MAIDKRKATSNVEHAKRWLNRANKDFNLFKKLVSFDSKTKKTVRCTDPALAVYLLQQSIEKAVKAAAIASGQYEARDFVRFYSHNSLALILNLNTKMITKIRDLGLDSIAGLMGIDLPDGESKLNVLESQVLGKTPLISKEGKRVSFKQETLSLKPEVIDKLLDSSIFVRKKFLDTIKSTFSLLPSMGIRKGHYDVENADDFIRKLSEGLSSQLKTTPLSEEQLKAPLEFIKIMDSFGLQAANSINRDDMTANYLSTWGFSYSLLWLTYLTFAHESSSRYPLKHKGNINTGRLGCDDYTEGLGIVNRIGQIGYATSLTLNEMKNEIENVAYLFAANRS
ncbi:MAG: hypothetical protein ISS58_01525 [Dehalococcoidales bacterium]|nr:hypothetical protein [Dehalococcoidales bacterium]